jgi:nitrogen-specific signal transduction histidine kinase
VQEASKLFWGTLGVGWDVTDHASLEEQLQQARKMEAIGRLAGGVAHDFNNLLSVILSNVELFKNAMPEGHPHHSDVMDVESAALRGADLTRQLLAFARKQVVRPRPTHFVDVVRGLEPLLRRLITENISLECTLPGRVAMVEADPSQLEQVVINLAVNARDAMPKGGRLTIQTCDVHLDPEFAASHLQVTPGDYVMLAVADDGSGMSPEVRAHLFEPFYTTKEVGRGTGLGLATVYGIVTQLGGHISVYSEAETGTCIKVYLPALPAGTAAVVEPADGATHLDGNEVILVVEDDELVRRLARRVLTRHGYTVYEAPDGDLGEVLAAEHEPDLVLTDMVMPKMGGGELAQRLRARFPRLPIVYMSGYVGHVMPQPDRLTDGADFLQKPFTASGLLAAVRKLLDQR